MALKTKNYTISNGSWEQCRDKVRQLFQQLSTLDLPLMETSGGGVIDRDSDPTSDTFGEITLSYNGDQFDESPAGTFHIQHFHTEDTKRTCVGVDTEDGTGQSDTLVGYDAGSSSIMGFNTLIGAECGKTITTGFTNTGVGCLTFSAVDGKVARNTALGYYNQLNLLSRNNYTSACGNTSMGAFCCQNLVTGLWNSGMGYYALKSNKYGNGNFALGAHTFEFLNSTERAITAFADAGGGQITVTTNTAGLVNGDEVRLTATDNYDDEYIIANVTGTTFEITKVFAGDDATGYATLETEGCYNVGIGLAVGYSTTTGGLNVFIGNRSGYSNVTGSSNVFIGAYAGYNETGSNKLYITNSDTVNPLIYGEFDNDLLKVNGQLEILSTTTPQLKLSYDGSNNATFAVSSAGDLTLDATANIIVGTDLETDRWLQSDRNTLIGVGAAGAGNLAHSAGNEGWQNTAVGNSALYSNTIGENNTAIGYLALYTNTTGINNVALGSTTLHSNTIGDDNLGMGRSALYTNTTGSSNTAIGRSALYDNTGGDNNTAIGNTALANNIGASNNTAIGNSSLLSNTTGVDNTAIGATALLSNVSGSGNIAIGRSSLYNSKGSYNVGIGRSALFSHTTGNYNIGIGYEANRYNQTGSNNTVLGHQAGRGTANHNKSGNVFIGYQAGYNEGGDNKLYIENSNSATPLIYGEFDNDLVKINGQLEVLSTSTPQLKLSYDGGNSATFAVSSTGDITLDATANIIVGTDLETDRWLLNDRNTFIGVGVVGAGNLAHAAGNEGWYNTALGYNSLYSNTKGYNNSAQGSNALYANTTGTRNCAQGSNALYANTTGTRNCAQGDGALYSNTIGAYNTAQGTSALYFNTEGNYNTVQGTYALFSNTEGNYNTAQGNDALFSNTTGEYNIGIGTDANKFNQTGSNNTMLGYQAGRGTANHNKSGNIFIGYQAGYNEGGSNKLYIENSNSATPLIYGEFDNNIVNINGLLTVDGLKVKYVEDNVADPPTDAQLDTAFGTPAALGAGYIGILDDNSADTDVYVCFTNDTSWWYIKGTKAA